MCFSAARKADRHDQRNERRETTEDQAWIGQRLRPSAINVPAICAVPVSWRKPAMTRNGCKMRGRSVEMENSTNGQTFES